MEAIRSSADHITDEATKVILNNVVKRKKKYDHYKSRHFISVYLTLGLAGVFLYYIYRTVISPYAYSFYEMYEQFFQNPVHLLGTIILAGVYGSMLYFKKKMDKAEMEFHALRCEIVDRSKDLWKSESAWKNRHIVFQKMKDMYDINLFHENK